MESFKMVYEQLKIVREAPGSLIKIKYLKEFLEFPMFKKVVTMALSSDQVFHIKSFPKYTPSRLSVANVEQIVFRMLETLNSQSGASSQDKLALHNLACTSIYAYDIIKYIVTKDIKCDVGVKTINKALPGTIYYTPYCRCSTDSKEDAFWKSKGKKYAQLKEDGMFFNLLTDDMNFITRNGKPILQLEKLQDKLSTCADVLDGLVIMGEMVIVHAGVVMDRQTGNGILNKLIHGTAPQHEADKVALRIWDAVPIEDFWEGDCPIHYVKRLEKCIGISIIFNDPSILGVVYTEEVQDKAAADDFYVRMRAQGEEGSVLKLGTALWKDHTSPNQIKKKNVSSCTLRMVGWKFGVEGSKYEDVMGALFFESECGKLKVTINGKSDEMRAFDWDNLNGSLWNVLFERVSYSKNKTDASLYLPRLEKQRNDKSEADTLKVIMERAKID